MRYLSLFSGIGGFELGIGTEHECVGYSEIDKYATEIYSRHFPTHRNYGDITKINPLDLPRFDFLVGGFPCQSFSIAGRRGGFNDTRGTLFFDIARIIEKGRPRRFLLENVKGLLSHDAGNTFLTIISTLTKLGYDLQWQVLNSKNHGVPQNRERVYIVGHLRGTPRPKVFPFGENDGVHIGQNEATQGQPQAQLSTTIRSTTHKVKADDTFIVHNVYGGFKEKEVREFRDVSPTIRTPKGGGHLPLVYDLKAKGSKTRRGFASNSGNAKTLDQNSYQGVDCEARIRRLTPVECERLQGFPDNWTEGLSDTQRYKTIGNAVTVNTVRDICVRLLME